MTGRPAAHLPAPVKRGLVAAEAAAYVGAPSVEVFLAEVTAGVWPDPMHGTRARRQPRWDRAALDLAMDRMSGLVVESSPSGNPLDRGLGLGKRVVA